MKLRLLLRTLPVVVLAATLGTAAARPKAKASPSPSPAAATQDATPASTPAPATSPAGTTKRTVSPDTLKKRYLTELQHQAGLTAAQEPKVTPIISTYVDSRQAVKNDTSLDTKGKVDKLKQLHTQYVSDINKVLTPDQQKKWAAYNEARRARLRAAREKRAAANATGATAGAAAQPTPTAKPAH